MTIKSDVRIAFQFLDRFQGMPDYDSNVSWKKKQKHQGSWFRETECLLFDNKHNIVPVRRDFIHIIEAPERNPHHDIRELSYYLDDNGDFYCPKDHQLYSNPRKIADALIHNGVAWAKRGYVRHAQKLARERAV